MSFTAEPYRYDPAAYRQVFEHRFTYLAGVKRNSHRFADRTALTDVASGRSWTYAELWADAGRLAAALAQADVQAGEVVVFALFNSAEFVLAWLATQRLGAIAAPINFRLSGGEIAHVLDDSQPAVFIYDQALELVAADAIVRAEHQPRLLIAAGSDTAPALAFDTFLDSVAPTQVGADPPLPKPHGDGAPKSMTRRPGCTRRAPPGCPRACRCARWSRCCRPTM